MAVLARRTWAQMLTELQLRLGNITATGFSDRLQYLLTASYYDLCTTYHHVELDKIDTSVSCSTSNNEITLPTDLFKLVGIRLKAVGGASILGPVVLEDYRLSSDLYTLTSGRPSRGGRFGTKFYFDKLPDAAYPLEIFYYRYPTAPDFGATSPELGPDLDEHILQGAIRLGFPAIARGDLGDVSRTLLEEWLQAQVRASLLEPLTALPERERTGTTYSRGQG